MNARFDGADEELLGPRELVEFEALLRRGLEHRIVQAAQAPREPSAEEAAQLARMAAHIATSDVVHRPRALPLRPAVRAAAQPTPASLAVVDSVVDSVVGNAPHNGWHARAGAATPPRNRRRALLRTYGVLAALALGVALLRGPALGPDGESQAVDLTARGTSDAASTAMGDAYLGDGQRPEPIAFPGQVTWDLRGQDGLVLVTVTDIDGDERSLHWSGHVEGSVWTPDVPPPKRFHVLVDRPADDGLSRERLHCQEYFLP